MGKANPIGGHSDPELHSFGDNMSEFTSWTTDPDVANYFANRYGSGGVVLHQKVPQSQLIQSDHSLQLSEAEFLRRGAIEGANVLKPKN